MCLKKEQLNFLKKEFSLTFDKVVKMKKNEWDELREKCFDIEVDEAMNGEQIWLFQFLKLRILRFSRWYNLYIITARQSSNRLSFLLGGNYGRKSNA